MKRLPVDNDQSDNHVFFKERRGYLENGSAAAEIPIVFITHNADQLPLYRLVFLLLLDKL